MSTIRKKKEVDIPDSAFEPKNIKRRISIFLDLDIINYAKEKTGDKGYQTFINDTLRKAFFDMPEREWKVLQTEVNKLKVRLNKLEKKKA